MSAAQRRVVALVSGADSEILVCELLSAGWTVLPLYVRCGFRWETAELPRVRRALAALRHPALKPLVIGRAPMQPLMKGHWSLTGRGVPSKADAWDSVYLPGRNMLLLLEAWLHAVRCGASAVAIGTVKGNPFPDATPRFRAAAELALNLAVNARVRVLAPYARLEKRDVLKRAGRFPLKLAFSCLSPRGGRACGRCSKCGELASALRGKKHG
jgi:7-cyano-7-deazaguanine synthase